jgi:hypothetical protein
MLVKLAGDVAVDRRGAGWSLFPRRAGRCFGEKRRTELLLFVAELVADSPNG